MLEIIKTKPQFNTDKTVLFLHGWGGDKNSFLFAQKSMKDDFNTINLSFNGFGKTPAPKRPWCVFDYAVEIYLMLKKENIKKLSIVAHSFGGRVAILLSSVFNIEIEELILVSSAGLKPRRNILYYFRIYLYKACKGLATKKLLPKKALKIFGSSDYKALNGIMRQTFIKVVNGHLDNFVPKIRAKKALVVWGKKDKSTKFCDAKVLQKTISNSKLLVYKNAGHFSYAEYAVDFCNNVILFINSD